jgi:hypothetical protein
VVSEKKHFSKEFLMAKTTYQCAVDMHHTKTTESMAAPFCCGKPMFKFQTSKIAAQSAPGQTTETLLAAALNAQNQSQGDLWNNKTKRNEDAPKQARLLK